jgi:hypothetical protein
VLRREPLLAAVVGIGDGARPDVAAAWQVLRDLPFTTVTLRVGVERGDAERDDERA